MHRKIRLISVIEESVYLIKKEFFHTDNLKKFTNKELPQNLIAIPMDNEENFTKFVNNTHYSYLEISTDYFGGAGEQTARKISYPTIIYEKFDSIDDALKNYGVIKDSNKDEFDTINLGHYRSNEDFCDIVEEKVEEKVEIIEEKLYTISDLRDAYESGQKNNDSFIEYFGYQDIVDLAKIRYSYLSFSPNIRDLNTSYLREFKYLYSIIKINMDSFVEFLDKNEKELDIAIQSNIRYDLFKSQFVLIAAYYVYYHRNFIKNNWPYNHDTLQSLYHGLGYSYEN